LGTRTQNFALLFNVAYCPVTVPKPLVASAGTVAEINIGETTVKAPRCH
jgi:hypothetical protein